MPNASWEICILVKKQQLEPDMEQQTGSKLRKECQGCMLSPCLFNLHVEYIIWNAGLDEAQAVIKIAGRNINNLRYADDTTLMTEGEEELRSHLMKVKEETEEAGLKFNIRKTNLMTSGPITSWYHHCMANRWENNGNSNRLYFLGCKIPADGECSHEIKRCLLLGRKAMTNLDSVLKNRAITLPTKVCLIEKSVHRSGSNS